MTGLNNTGAATAAPAFDATRWLSDFTTLGGIYALGADRRLSLIAHGPLGPDLAEMVAQLIGEPSRQDAIRAAIESRQMVEVL